MFIINYGINEPDYKLTQSSLHTVAVCGSINKHGLLGIVPLPIAASECNPSSMFDTLCLGMIRSNPFHKPRGPRGMHLCRTCVPSRKVNWDDSLTTDEIVERCTITMPKRNKTSSYTRHF